MARRPTSAGREPRPTPRHRRHAQWELRERATSPGPPRADEQRGGEQRAPWTTRRAASSSRPERCRPRGGGPRSGGADGDRRARRRRRGRGGRPRCGLPSAVSRGVSRAIAGGVAVGVGGSRRGDPRRAWRASGRPSVGETVGRDAGESTRSKGSPGAPRKDAKGAFRRRARVPSRSTGGSCAVAAPVEPTRRRGGDDEEGPPPRGNLGARDGRAPWDALRQAAGGRPRACSLARGRLRERREAVSKAKGPRGGQRARGASAGMPQRAPWLYRPRRDRAVGGPRPASTRAEGIERWSRRWRRCRPGFPEIVLADGRDTGDATGDVFARLRGRGVRAAGGDLPAQPGTASLGEGDRGDARRVVDARLRTGSSTSPTRS